MIPSFRKARCHRKSRQAGFSILEMIVALAIIGLAVTLIMPLARRPPGGLRLESSARGLCAALRLARTQAIVNNRIESVVIDLAGKSYGTSTAAKGVLPNDTEIKLTVADSQRLSGMRAGFSFFPNGGSTGGEIELSLAGKRIDIGVNWLTGEANCGV